MNIQYMNIRLRLMAGAMLLCLCGAGRAQSVIQFSVVTYLLNEDTGVASLTLQRTNDVNSGVTVDFATTNGTATAGLDYIGTNGTLVFAAGQTTQTFCIPIVNDGLAETPRESFSVFLSNPTGGAVLGTAISAVVIINDNDVGLQFEFGAVTFGSYRVGENESSILLAVVRNDDGDLPVTVSYQTTPGTATAGADYATTNGTLCFAPGQKLAFITVPILNDAFKESNETLTVRLSSPTNQVLGAQNVATVTIVDNDNGVQFQPYSIYRVAENAGAVSLKVVRGNDMNLAPFTVNFATRAGTAAADLDYASTNGTLDFGEGELCKNITIEIMYDESPEPDEQFGVTLSSPAGGAVLGTYYSSTITIVDVTNTHPHRFEQIAVAPDQKILLSMLGGADQHFKDYFDLYPVEVSANLVDWTPLSTLLRTNTSTNVFTYTDTTATNFGLRFYRTPTNELITPWAKPTGPFAVGEVTRLLEDPTRRNRYGQSRSCAFAVTVWYPAVAQAGLIPTRCADLQLGQDPTWVALYGKGDFSTRMPYLRSHALANIPCATNQAPYPILLFSPGYTGVRSGCAEMGASIASHGYVVVTVDHYDAIRTVLPDGTYLQGDVTSPMSLSGLADRVQDLSLILDELTRWNIDDALFSCRLDLTKVAASGGSWGGATAGEFARTDRRCGAVIGLDGGSAGEVKLTHPVLEIRREDNTASNLYENTTNHGVWFQISGTDHLMIAGTSYFWGWQPHAMDGGREVARTMNAYVLWFLNKYLKEINDPLPPGSNHPLVMNLRQK